MSNAVYQIVTDRIIKEMEKGVIPWERPWQGKHLMPANLVSKKVYHGFNVFMLGFVPYESNYWVTYKQAQDLGGNVKKGEHGFPVIFWKIVNPRDREDETGQIVREAKDKESYAVLRYYTVFNACQCEGIDYPKPEMAFNENQALAEGERIITDMPHKPEICLQASKACYYPGQDKVFCPSITAFHTSQGFYATMFHELVHSTGHESRLNRRGNREISMYGDQDYSFEELVAELGSAFVCAYAGINNQKTGRNNAAYIQGWLKRLKSKDNSKWLVQAAAMAQKASDYILNVKPEFIEA